MLAVHLPYLRHLTNAMLDLLKLFGLGCGVLFASIAIDQEILGFLGVLGTILATVISTSWLVGRKFQSFLDENRGQSARIAALEGEVKSIIDKIDKLSVNRRVDGDSDKAESFSTPLRSPLRVLLVDDDKNDRFLFRRALPGNYEIDEAATLREGIKMGSLAKYDCVVLDLRLPDSVPEETVAAFVASHPMACCVAMSGSVPETMISRIIKQGADSFITKGIYNGEYLNKMIRLAIQRNKTTIKSDTDWFRRQPTK